MDTRFIRFIKASVLALGILSGVFPSLAQEVETLELSTGTVHPLLARIGSACLIQLPVEPVATNVGDAQLWMVERTERHVSLKPVNVTAKDTTLAILTRQGTLNFAVHLAPEGMPFTQMVRVTRIVDDSKPLPPVQSGSQETPVDILVREIRVAQNYYALKQVHAKELHDVEQVTHLRETGTVRAGCTLLQVFRFRDTRHLVLHFITENKTAEPLSFDHRQTTVSAGDAFFVPLAVSLGGTSLPPKASAENFIVLDGSNGLSPRNLFDILLVEQPTSIPDETR